MELLFRNNKGSTLIEAIVAMALASVVIASCLQLSENSTQSYGNLKLYSASSQVLQDLTEQFLISFNSDGSLDAGNHTKNYDQFGHADPYGPIQVKWTVEDNNPIPALNKIQLTAHWNTNYTTRSQTLTFYKQTGLGPGSGKFNTVPVPYFAGCCPPPPPPPPYIPPPPPAPGYIPPPPVVSTE